MFRTTNEVQKKTSRKDNGVSVAAVSANQEVTNHTDTDLVVIDARLSNSSAAAELYQRSLQPLLATNGEQTVKAGETQTFSFSKTHTDTDENDADDTLILARAADLFPVKVVTLPASEDGGNFSAVTVTANDAGLMKKAETFLKTMAAFPTSDLVKKYLDVLQAAPDEEKITAVFNGSPDFTGLTMEAIAAVQSYHLHYGFAWGSTGAGKTYYLNTSDGEKDTFCGSVTVKNKMVAPVTNLDAPAGFTATYTDAKGTTIKTLYYANGQFSEDAGSSAPAICLQGSFRLEADITGKEEDNILIPVLMGKIDNAEVLGTEMKIGKSFLETMLHPEGLKGWLKSGGMAGALLLVVAALGFAAYYLIKRSRNRSRPSLPPEEVRRLNREAIQRITERMGAARVPLPEDLNAATKDIKAKANENLLRDARTKMESTMNTQRGAIQRLADYGRNTELQSADMRTTLDIDDILNPLKNGDPQDLLKHYKEMREHISQNARLINDTYKKREAKFDAADRKAIDDFKERSERFTRAVDTNGEIRKNLEEDILPEIEIEG